MKLNYYIAIFSLCVLAGLCVNGCETKNVTTEARYKMPRGVFVLMRKKDLYDLENVLSKPYIAGATIYLSWNKLEPIQGKIDYAQLKKIISLAVKYKKTVNFGFLCGRGTPRWVYSQGVKAVIYTHSKFLSNPDSPPIKMKTPDPWSKKYWKLYAKFLQAVSPIINDSESVGYVAITGPSPSNGIETNFSIGAPVWVQDKKNSSQKKPNFIKTLPYQDEFEKSGFTESLFVKGWLESAEIFKMIFPDKQLGIALHHTYGPNHNSAPAEEIIKGCKKSIGRRVALMLLGLDDGRIMINDEKPYKDMLIKARKEYPETIIGLQMVGIFSLKKNDTGERLTNAIKNGQKYFSPNFKWAEIWYEDFKFSENNSSYRRAFQKCAELMQKH